MGHMPKQGTSVAPLRAGRSPCSGLAAPASLPQHAPHSPARWELGLLGLHTALGPGLYDLDGSEKPRMSLGGVS